MQRESRHRNYFPLLSGHTEQSWTKKWDWRRQNFATSIVTIGLGPRRWNVVFSAFLLQIHIHSVWCVEVMSLDASQHDLSLLIASGNATETQYTDISIIVWLWFWPDYYALIYADRSGESWQFCYLLLMMKVTILHFVNDTHIVNIALNGFVLLPKWCCQVFICNLIGMSGSVNVC
jgi:hypothetical protein